MRSPSFRGAGGSTSRATWRDDRLGLRDPRTRRRCTGRCHIFLATVTCTVGFFLLPSTYRRPTEAGGGITGGRHSLVLDRGSAQQHLPLQARGDLGAVGAGRLDGPGGTQPAQVAQARRWRCSGGHHRCTTTKQHYLVDTAGRADGGHGLLVGGLPLGGAPRRAEGAPGWRWPWPGAGSDLIVPFSPPRAAPPLP